MTTFDDELSQLLSLARSWTGQELSEDNIHALVKWLGAQRAAAGATATQINRELANASAVISEGQQAAEATMNHAFQSVNNPPQHARPPIHSPPLQERVSSAEQAAIEQMLKQASVAANGPPEQSDLSRLAQSLSEIIKIQVREQVEKFVTEAAAKLDLKLTEINSKTEHKLTDIANGATEICNKLSADIREQLVKDLVAEAHKAAAPVTGKKT